MRFSSKKVSIVARSLLFSSVLVGCGAILVAAVSSGTVFGNIKLNKDSLVERLNNDFNNDAAILGINNEITKDEVFASIGSSMQYPTKNLSNVEIEATGLFSMPIVDFLDLEETSFLNAPLSIVLNLHDIFLPNIKENSILIPSSSFNPIDINIERFTGLNGHVLLVPDYIGFGKKHEVSADGSVAISEDNHPYDHPYMIKESLITASIDMLKSAKAFLDENNMTFNKELFISGTGEGAYAAIAIAQEIEEKHSKDFTVTAVAAIGGPYDLTLTENETKNTRFKDELKSSYQKFYNLSNDVEFQNKLEENSLHTINWNPKTPIRLYHCKNSDQNVSFTNTQNLSDNLESKAVIEIIYDPGKCEGNNAYNDIAKWFNSLDTGLQSTVY